MSGAPFETPPPFTNWGLVLDGDVQQDAVSRGGYCTTQQFHARQTPRLSARAGSGASTAATVAIRQANSSNSGHPNPGSAAALDDWERSAVDLYREIRRHRSEGPQQTRNGAKLRDSTQVRRRLDTSECSSPSPCAALMVTAFPQLLGGPFAAPGPAPANLACDSTAGTPQLPSSSPLLLQYFLSIGYPLRPPYNTEAAAASHSAALVAVAQETVAWFEDSGVAVENTAPRKTAAPLHRFGVRLLPDVVQQIVAAHQMTPATAAAWLLRVYVGLLAPWEAKEDSIQGAITADYGFENGPLDPGMPPAFCMEGVWRWANAMCTAVYHLQTSTRAARETSLHESEKRSSDALSSSGREKTVLPQGMQSLASEHRTDGVGWRLFALTVLQKTTTLILRGCFTTATVDATNASQDPISAEAQEQRVARGGLKQDTVGAQSSSPLESETIMPPVPTTRVAVEGLACFALLVRLHERFPKHGKMRHDAGGVHARAAATHVADATQAMVEKHWERHAQLAVQQLPHLPPHYHHLVHMMDFVLTA
ncbi:conserved hypothetical protein [Leishmania mexicana MHOM/GT/2001/U1103]|uniref:Uncharacterized protein n=1 Tax=Leishmania mexicana (strain MHOM/GT/2001/U1103) TaxID=929439 RepID=E9ALM5_LEIMU|nr:conserved hypothetical protein [Leishmania mexicana MHOM/GT/2001/U1103]CBZ23830.1 conserved hypothetical protein [Leishmania mexicana MHOM/GT/2001/U1103]